MRGSMMARMVLLGGICLSTMGSQFSCTSGNGGSLQVGNPNNGDSLTVDLVLRKATGEQSSTFRLGEPIVFETKVTNNTGIAHDIQLPSSQVSDLLVLDAGGTQPRWNQAAGMAFLQVVTTVRIPPYDSRTTTFQWNAILNDGTQLMPGTYEARGMYAYPQYITNVRQPNELASPLRSFTITN